MRTSSASSTCPSGAKQHRTLAVRQWVNPRVAVLAYGTLPLSVTGQDARAEHFTLEALELAGRIGHAHTTALSLTYRAIGSQLRWDARATLEWVDQCIPLSVVPVALRAAGLGPGRAGPPSRGPGADAPGDGAVDALGPAGGHAPQPGHQRARASLHRQLQALGLHEESTSHP
ncbi:hypothetical protein [Archangium violaceum]|uniref:hypothetical protein n=1 Tax=Archangium violaceum TaxID=83451 RepID=UPI001EEFC5D7|nr:hypothetical protein [Archangium violaceum]